MTYFQAELNEALEAIVRVVEFHRHEITKDINGKESGTVCYGCKLVFSGVDKCDTIKALEGTL